MDRIGKDKIRQVDAVDRQIDRQIDRQVERQTGRQRETEREIDRQIDGWMDGWTDRWMDGWIDRQIDRQVDRWMGWIGFDQIRFYYIGLGQIDRLDRQIRLREMRLDQKR